MVWVLLAAGALGVSCKPSAAEIAERAAASDESEKRSAHEATVKRLAAASAEALKVQEHDKVQTDRNNLGRDACQRIAVDTRACIDGKQACTPMGDDGPACLRYMQVNHLEKNPF